MKFTVVTPSFGQLRYLRLNAASIADQHGPGIEVEHIVQDGGSKDGTREWLATRPDIIGVAEADEGMYDAINRGIKKGTGEIFSWLNCDEQFLPGTLAAVKAFFEQHPQVDMVAGDTLVVDSKGEYQCHRKAVVPTTGILRLGRTPVQSCSLFFRARLVKGERAVLFDPQWKAMGDWAWLRDQHARGARMERLPRFLATFVDDGGNLGMSPQAIKETRAVYGALSTWHRATEYAVRGADYFRKFMDGYYRQKPFDYAIYQADEQRPSGVSESRQVRYVAKPTWHWKGRAH
ncbi:MAG: glycosyltransferase [Flavobacteriales bacterium]|jgi:glycosyltransferase involved in cell wall biosynthesis|nr:glycosyltransferase [Flavobacteriales bacterium]